MRSNNFAGIIGCSAMIAGSSLQLAAQKIEPKTNIVLIITDQQSSDAMSSRIGSRYLKTPNMDYLASHGVTFTRAYCANPLCIPSRSSMFTGLYPHQVGIQANDNEKTLSALSFQMMGTIFQKGGYETSYFGKWHLPYDIKNKESHGFEWMSHNKSNGVDSLIPDDAIGFLQQKHEKPFLMVASFIDPHNICEWARGQKLPDGEVGIPPKAEDCPPLLANHAPSKNESDIVSLLRSSAQASPMFPVGNFDDTKWRQYRWAYYRMIEKVDGQIGKILDELRKSGIDKNTVILFLADHGDSQGAHFLNQKTNFFEEVVNVPFIITLPGKSKPEISSKLIQTGIDLIPTLCDYAGIQVPAELPGLSAKKILADKKNSDRSYVVTSVKPIQGAPVNGVKPDPDGRMVRGERYKYWIYSQGTQRESLFDTQKDPGEMVNLATDPKFKSVLVEYRKNLENWCIKYSDSFAQYLIK
ncbi:MAG: sulfatase-like hydrolase/transferase [Prolixibacteraceae bacterium]